eukprot:CAMPEP_0119042806 /NCGR_PEP_ID=MMETSP1177-20130426/16174_1 /TAXON_ID=2985 /ORGANISM="Ochromonas sp, Strain CCMP1899" /LENGTH=221 /DNA_ID=CAMNT_0007009831 /DNA_START=259 /DNA_END=924 /DNA_ORIENTATION=+
MALDPVTILDSTHTLLDSSSSLLLNFLQRVDPDQAKGEFFFFFFGGSGALGIGAAQVPKIAAELDFINKLGGSPTTKGGDDLDANFIATLGYPEPLKIADVQKVIDDAPFVEKILAAGNKKSYMAQIGYLERQGFNDCFTDCNPLAVHAAFDAIAGGGGDLATPTDAAVMITKWKKEGTEGFVGSLTRGNFRKYSAYGVFVFLILLVLDLIVESGANAFIV